MDTLKTFFDKIKPTNDDTAVDRLHYVYTCMITLFLGIAIGFYQFAGNPIKCWMPAQFTDFWGQYVHDYCFVENTYWVSWGRDVPDDVIQREDQEIQYYQWIPFVLALQALLYYVPHAIWSVLNWQSGNPIVCWTPAQFNAHWDEYVEDICFVEHTYYVPLHKSIPWIYEGQFERSPEPPKIKYYQWIPFVLALQAFLFSVPHAFWRAVNYNSGVNVEKIVNMASDAKNVDYATRDTNVEMIAQHIFQSLDIQKDYGSRGNALSAILRCGRNTGVYVTVLYLIVKVLFLANVIGQFFLMNDFLGPQYSWWGLDILNDLRNGTEWEMSGHFPRVTLCDFQIRVLGNLQRYTVQCVLWINMLNEKVYLFLWWWFFMVAIVSILDLLYWVVITVIPGAGKRFVCRYLRAAKAIRNDDEASDFVTNYLKLDGVFILRILSSNVGDMATTYIADELYNCYDQKIHPGQEGQYQDAFDRADTDKDKSLNLAEVQQALHDLSLPVVNLTKTFNRADSNKDGKIDYKEFRRLLKHRLYQ